MNRQILRISLVILLTAGISSGATYFVMQSETRNEKTADQSSSNSKESTDKQRDELVAEENSRKASLPSATDSIENENINPVQESLSQEDGVDESGVRIDTKPEYPNYSQSGFADGCYAAGNGPMGFIKRTHKAGDIYYMDVDLAEYYCGQQAYDEGKKDGAEEVNNSYWMRNKNPRIYTFRLSADPTIVLNYNSADHNLNMSFDTWINKFNGPDNALVMLEGSMKVNPYWLTFDGDRVTKLVMQFLP